MNRREFSKLLVWLMFFIFVLNSLAMKFYWYSFIWYFDMPMHFLGGLFLGLSFLYLFPVKNSADTGLITKTLFFVLFIGVGWEVFEIIVNDVITNNPFNFLDTASDLFFDLAGGMLAILYFLKRIMTNTVNTVQ